MHGMADVFAGSAQVVAQVRRFVFHTLVALLQGVRRLVQMLARTVDALAQAFGPLPDLVLCGGYGISRTRSRRTVLAHHQP
ncbi:hypothetical protein D3C80_1921610 [compost metagenome]